MDSVVHRDLSRLFFFQYIGKLYSAANKYQDQGQKGFFFYIVYCLNYNEITEKKKEREYCICIKERDIC